MKILYFQLKTIKYDFDIESFGFYAIRGYTQNMRMKEEAENAHLRIQVIF